MKKQRTQRPIQQKVLETVTANSRLREMAGIEPPNVEVTDALLESIILVSNGRFSYEFDGDKIRQSSADVANFCLSNNLVHQGSMFRYMEVPCLDDAGNEIPEQNVLEHILKSAGKYRTFVSWCETADVLDENMEFIFGTTAEYEESTYSIFMSQQGKAASLTALYRFLTEHAQHLSKGRDLYQKAVTILEDPVEVQEVLCQVLPNAKIDQINRNDVGDDEDEDFF